MASVTVRDETATGREIDSWVLPDLPETISARELVRLRVREEVARHNLATPQRFRGLVQPTSPGSTRDGERPAPPHRLDWARQADIACAAFARNGFLIFTGDRQIDDLDETIDLRTDVEVSFVRLVPLVGG